MPVSIDLKRVRQRKRDIVDSFRNRSQARIEKSHGVDLIFGKASFNGPKTIEILAKDGTQQVISANFVFINTGTRASRPKLDGVDSVSSLDNVSIMELDTEPEHLMVLGGGYIGLEFGQLFRRFGSRVTIVQSSGQLLKGEDPDVAQEVANILEQDGIEILLNARASRIRQLNGILELEIQLGGSRTLAGSHLLVATGRVPNSDTLNLVAAGVETDPRGFIKVNDRFA